MNSIERIIVLRQSAQQRQEGTVVQRAQSLGAVVIDEKHNELATGDVTSEYCVSATNPGQYFGLLRALEMARGIAVCSVRPSSSGLVAHPW